MLLKLYETCHHGSKRSDGFSLGKHTWLERYTKYLLCPHTRTLVKTRSNSSQTGSFCPNLDNLYWFKETVFLTYQILFVYLFKKWYLRSFKHGPRAIPIIKTAVILLFLKWQFLFRNVGRSSKLFTVGINGLEVNLYYYVPNRARVYWELVWLLKNLRRIVTISQ